MNDIPEIRFAGLTYRLPFVHLFRPHTATERAAMAADIAELGVLGRVVTYDSDRHGARCVIDGATRLSIADSQGKSVPVHHRGTLPDERAEREAVSLNTARRHLSEAEQDAYRSQRNQDIIADRLAGDSLRVIGDRFGLHETVIRDIFNAWKQSAGVGHPTPDRVTGCDGKQYPATSPGVARSPEYYLHRATLSIHGVQKAFDELLAGRMAPRLREICDRHRFNPATVEAVLADLTAEAVQEPRHL